MIDHVAAAGTAAEVCAKVKAFVDAGARHFIFSPMSKEGKEDAIIDRTIAEVIPEVRETYRIQST